MIESDGLPLVGVPDMAGRQGREGLPEPDGCSCRVTVGTNAQLTTGKRLLDLLEGLGARIRTAPEGPVNRKRGFPDPYVAWCCACLTCKDRPMGALPAH